jgi:hypothetical protein
MTLNSTGLGVGVSPTYKFQSVGIAAATSSTFNGSGGNLIGALLNSDDANSGANPGLDLRRWTGTANNHGTSYIATNSAGETLFYNGAAASNTRATSLKMTLDASGNLLVGTTSTAGSSSNTTVAVFGGVKTASGVTAIGPSAATTIFTISSGNRGKYSVVAYIANGGVANTIMADIVWDGANARLVAQNSANLTVTVSGAAIQLTQTVGGTQNYFWSVVWQAT